VEYHAGEHDAFSSAENPTPLVSSDAAAAIAAQFQTLAASMVINDSGLLHDYAREMLRPMLKAWLDDNLPVLVERLVRAEIERVARGGRR
jgi:cell pole-organizing protein PopZ